MANATKCIGKHGINIEMARIKELAGSLDDAELIKSAEKIIDEYAGYKDHVINHVKDSFAKIKEAEFINDTPEITAAKKIISQNTFDDRPITMQFEDGTEVVGTLKELMTNADIEMRDAEQAPLSIKAAITCFLGG